MKFLGAKYFFVVRSMDVSWMVRARVRMRSWGGRACTGFGVRLLVDRRFSIVHDNLSTTTYSTIIPIILVQLLFKCEYLESSFDLNLLANPPSSLHHVTPSFSPKGILEFLRRKWYSHQSRSLEINGKSYRDTQGHDDASFTVEMQR